MQEILDIFLEKSKQHPAAGAARAGGLTSKRSTSPHGLTSSPLERSPITCPKGHIHSFGNMLSPGTFSAQNHSTSELLRTL